GQPRAASWPAPPPTPFSLPSLAGREPPRARAAAGKLGRHGRSPMVAAARAGGKGARRSPMSAEGGERCGAGALSRRPAAVSSARCSPPPWPLGPLLAAVVAAEGGERCDGEDG